MYVKARRDRGTGEVKQTQDKPLCDSLKGGSLKVKSHKSQGEEILLNPDICLGI